MAVYYSYENRMIKKDDIVVVNPSINSLWKIDELITGDKRKKYAGKQFKVSKKWYTRAGHIRVSLEGIYGIVWSPKMLQKIEREENEI